MPDFKVVSSYTPSGDQPQAIAALAGLAEGERLVGIISHVGELKDQIDRQIVVKKEKTGGSHVTIRV